MRFRGRSAPGEAEVTAYSRLIRSCGDAKDLAEGKRIHARIAASPHASSRFLANLLIAMYGKCRSVSDASLVFQKIEEPNLFSWTMIVGALAQNGHLEEARAYFDRMKQRDEVSWTTMVSTYAQYGRLRKAREMFGKMPHWDVVSWNAMLAAFTQNGHFDEAISMFQRMPQRDVATGNTMIGIYGQTGQVLEAKSVFDRMSHLNMLSWNSLITTYAYNGHTQEAKALFDKMPQRNVLPWTAMLIAYGLKGNVREVKSMFDSMPQPDVVSWNVLLQAYAQNGHLVEAQALFETFLCKDVITWNVIVHACTQRGNPRLALELHTRMYQDGIEPDEVSFISALNACSHLGLVDESRGFFLSMAERGMSPAVDHFFCMVDVLGRAGHLADAEDLLENMPYLPDANAWLTLMSACSLHADAERAARAARKYSELNPESVSPYIQLGNRSSSVVTLEKLTTAGD